ncbi:MAG: TIGR04283 family arsenosugar biosynthesis glycosyltransferase [Rhodospirillales bacterium]
MAVRRFGPGKVGPRMCYVWADHGFFGFNRDFTAAVLSIVIPTLNAGKDLPATLESLLQPGMPSEVIITDGGSTDPTPVIAAEGGAKLIATPGGRGPQLAAGADVAAGDWLLFLHADTRPLPGWGLTAKDFMEDPENRFRAGYFHFALNDPAPAARRLEAMVRWRCRVLGLPYGDQGLLISREFYDVLGGFRARPLMEDVDMARRIGRGRLRPLPVAAVTSADRYRREGYWMRPARNLLCVGLFFAGVPTRLIEALYE